MNHIHIISVGEHVHDGLPKILDEFKASKIILVVEENIYSEPGPPKKKQILHAMDEVRKTTELLGKEFEVKRLPKISLNNIRDAIFQIVNCNPDSKIYFNITHGTKVLSNGLFLMSIWLQGTVYYIDQSEGIQILSVPRMPVSDLVNNPNYISILDILAQSNTQIMLYKDTFKRLEPQFHPMRVSGITTKRTLQKGTFSKWVKDLRNWGLVEVEFVKGSDKEKQLRITNDGAFSLKFAKALGPMQ